ncbi:unnamed protein product [Phytomonas sp. Hart1]|nr:unnamed protein product [Phytomonas sp. Hart1]|eukprot:CCW69688.1 unnamed protein product [Phytomonas sp. isolate Hart1]
MNTHRSSSSPSVVETSETFTGSHLKGGERSTPVKPQSSRDQDRDLPSPENGARRVGMTMDEREKVIGGAGRSPNLGSEKSGAPGAAWFGRLPGALGKVEETQGPGLGDIRKTEEYQAAWDLELWKAIQAERFRRQLEQHRTRALKDLAQLVKRKEEETTTAMARRGEGLKAREASLEKEAAALKRRERALGESERGLQRVRQQLLEAQRRVEEESSEHARQLHEATHRASLLQARVQAAELQAQRAEERQRQTHADYLRLYADLRRERCEGAPAGGGGEPDDARVGPLREHYVEEQRLLRERMEQRHRAALAEVTQRCRELEAHNEHLAAALARRREQLRARRRQDNRGDDETSPSPSEAGLRRELGRLVEERAALLEGSAGAIDLENPVVLRLDARLNGIRRQLDRTQGSKKNRIDKMAT